MKKSNESTLLDGAFIGVCLLMLLVTILCHAPYGGWLVASVLAIKCAYRGPRR